ncbi:MAG: Hsp20/alpha crystallin family protein [Rubrobacter sp.]|nr:Hsp20/alpha crystallin family protein [Rubrobacter sp.]
MLSPFRGFMDARSEMNRMLEEMLSGMSRRGGRQQQDAALDQWAPATDVLSEDGDLVLRAELPGVKKDDVDISFANGVLTISGERRDEQESKDRGYHAREVRYGSFSRSLRLPEGTNPDDIHARFEDGMLEVTVKDAAQELRQRPRRIQIEGSEESQDDEQQS